MASPEFLAENSHALQIPKIVVRDSLGQLAIQILMSKEDISKMDYRTMLNELLEIVTNLHIEYHRAKLPDSSTV